MTFVKLNFGFAQTTEADRLRGLGLIKSCREVIIAARWIAPFMATSVGFMWR